MKKKDLVTAITAQQTGAIAASMAVIETSKAKLSLIETEHSAMVTTLAKPGQAILLSLDACKCHLIHMAVGVSGEAGELLEATTQENIIEELGDIEFYLEGLRQGLVALGGVYSQYEMVIANDPVKSLYVNASKLLDMVKKYVIYDKELEAMLPKMVSATQAVMTDLICTYNSFGLAREAVLDTNMYKLLKGKNARYAAGSYSDKAASDRADKVGTSEEETE